MKEEPEILTWKNQTSKTMEGSKPFKENIKIVKKVVKKATLGQIRQCLYGI